MGQTKMDNPEKLVAHGTSDDETQNTNTTQYMLDTTIGRCLIRR